MEVFAQLQSASPFYVAALVMGNALLLMIMRHIAKPFTRPKHYAASRITWKGTIVNWALWPETLLKRKPAFKKYTLESLQKSAIRNAKGPTDFGDKWYETAFSHACTMLATRPLSPLGQHVAYDSMMRRLLSRLRFQAELKKLPAGTLEKPLLPPVFVIGLPRTGTTFLHHLLALDTNVRCPLTYELFDVAPRYPNDPAKDRKARVAYVQNGIDQLKSIVPHIEAIHEIGAEEPEECFVSMAMDLPLVLATMPAYMEQAHLLWKWDFEPAYANHMKVLKLLAHQQGSEDKRWVLKAPLHLGFVKTIQKVFPPGTRIVWTHRDPKSSIPSLCSLFQTMIEMHEAGDVDLSAVGRTTLSFWSAMLKRADADLSSSSPNVAANKTNNSGEGHVKYENLIKDPVGTIRELYRTFGWDFSKEYEERLEAYVAKNKEDRAKVAKKGGKFHAYSLEQFGLDGAAVEKEMQWYKDKYL